jgi:UPF0176 protein
MIVNTAFYRFVALEEIRPLSEWRSLFKETCADLSLKGTILLSPEGINGFLAGASANIEAFKERIRSISCFQGLEFKDSPSTGIPHTRMLVKLKKEIISVGRTMTRDEINDPERSGARLAPQELKKWLDEGKDLLILDTRNDYEIRMGTFKNALDLDIKSFRQFPERLSSLPESLRKKPMVMFCTGGIRCEKASVLAKEVGFEEVYQLEGGILKYFEECGGSHYDGECFVFDHRVAVDPELSQTQSVLCFVCRNPLTVTDQNSPDYVYEKSCPYCALTREKGQERAV